MYQVMTEGQLLRLHPGKKDKTRNLLAYLVRQNRVWQVDGCRLAADDWEDPELLALYNQLIEGCQRRSLQLRSLLEQDIT